MDTSTCTSFLSAKMTETDLQREASKLYSKLGITVGAESLDFFHGTSVRLSDWKKRLRRPSQDTIRQIGRKLSGVEMAACFLQSGKNGRSQNGRRTSKPEVPVFQDALVGPEGEDDDALTDFGECGLCGTSVIGLENGCVAFEQVYHTKCFACNRCSCPLSGGSFYVLKGQILCEKDYRKMLERCHCCQQVITDKQIVRALGHSYHAVCFRCCVCGIGLDGIPFATDFANKIYCELDFHKMFAPKCAICREAIIPLPGESKSKRLISMDMSFHVECYCCEECGVSLTESDGGNRCYPLNEHILCLECHRVWLENGRSQDSS